jgi:DNA-binding GntR family transcriptional regulator
MIGSAQSGLQTLRSLARRKPLGQMVYENLRQAIVQGDLAAATRLVRMIDGLRDQIFRFRQIILQDEHRAAVSNADHRLLLERIRERDGAGVEQLVREHILKGQEMVLEAVGEDTLKGR